MGGAPLPREMGWGQLAATRPEEGIASHRSALGSKREEPIAQGVKRATAVAHAILLGRGELGKAPAAKPVGQEDRIVAETTLTTLTLADHARAAPLGEMQCPGARVDQRQHAAEVSPTLS